MLSLLVRVGRLEMGLRLDVLMRMRLVLLDLCMLLRVVRGLCLVRLGRRLAG